MSAQGARGGVVVGGGCAGGGEAGGDFAVNLLVLDHHSRGFFSGDLGGGAAVPEPEFEDAVDFREAGFPGGVIFPWHGCIICRVPVIPVYNSVQSRLIPPPPLPADPAPYRPGPDAIVHPNPPPALMAAKLFLAVVVLVGLMWFLGWYNRASPARRNRSLRSILLYGVGAAILVLVLTGRIPWFVRHHHRRGAVVEPRHGGPAGVEIL